SAAAPGAARATSNRPPCGCGCRRRHRWSCAWTRRAEPAPGGTRLSRPALRPAARCRYTAAPMATVTPDAAPGEFIPPGSRLHFLPSPFPMKRGGQLLGARVAYETWGRLNDARDNAVLIVTGLSPDAHAASHADDPTPGWWEAMLGPGKPI